MPSGGEHPAMPLAPSDNAKIPQRVTAFRLWTSATLPSQTHAHDHHEVIIPTRGPYRARLEDGDLAAAPGQLVGYPAGTVHHPQLPRRRGVEFLVVQWWGGLAPWRGLRDDHEHRARMAAEWLVDAVAHADAVTAQLLAALIAWPRPAAAAADDSARIIPRLCEEMRAKLEAPLSLDELATLAGWTPQHLIRRFRRETGRTPMAWFQEQRLRQARALLAGGEDLEQAARRCGYQHGRNLLRALRSTGL